MPDSTSVRCSGSQRLGFLSCLRKLARLLGSVRAAAARMGGRQPWGSQHRVLAENNCLCGQLASQLAEEFLETFGLRYIFRGTPLSRKLVAAGQC